MALKLTKAHNAILAGIAAGSITHVAKSNDVEALASNGYIEVNPSMLNEAGEAAVRLTDAGKQAAPGNDGTTEAPANAAPVFKIAPMVELPTIQRGGGTRESKYPLKDIPLGGGIFIPAEGDKTATSLSKQFGSMVAEFNKKNPDRFLTTRTLKDGAAAGFGDEFDGKAGVGIYHRPVSERKEKAAAAS